jgi:uncharacterized protein (DUF58 family)
MLATALNYRLPRRLTKAGLLVMAGVVLTGAIGSDIDQSMGSQAFAFFVCLLGVAFLCAPFFRGQFAVARALPRLASVGQPFRYRVSVRNLTQRSYRDLECLEDLADPRPGYEEFAESMRPRGGLRTFRLASRPRPRIDVRQALVKPAELPPLGSRATAEGDVEIVPLKRGPLRFTGITIARREPIGLVRGFVRVPLAQSVLVLPKRYTLPSLPFPGTQNYQAGGVALASSIGESEEFVSLREYRPGDPFRRIHWRSWARAGRPIVKEYQDEFFVRHGLVLDTFVEPAQAETFEEAVSIAASFACSLETQESLLDLLFVGCQAFSMSSGRGLGQSQQVLEILASVGPARDSDFESLQELVLRHASVLCGCICVFVNWDKPRRELLRKLQARGLPVLTLLVADKLTEEQLRRDEAGQELGQVHLIKPGRVQQDLQRLEGGAG